MSSIKVCGITNFDDAYFIANNGAAAIGFIFYEKSPRYIKPELAVDIISKIDLDIAFVGVFVDENIETVNSISKKVGLDFVQLHGNENPNYCKKVNLPVIKVFRIEYNFNFKILAKFSVHAFLFDTYDENLLGGTGKINNWSLLSKLNIDCPVILSGCINRENINDAISVVMPDAVDINSGVEKFPGIKDHSKIKLLFNNVVGLNGSINPFKKIYKGI